MLFSQAPCCHKTGYSVTWFLGYIFISSSRLFRSDTHLHVVCLPVCRLATSARFIYFVRYLERHMNYLHEVVDITCNRNAPSYVVLNFLVIRYFLLHQMCCMVKTELKISFLKYESFYWLKLLSTNSFCPSKGTPACI